jgi:hypothetical protein
MRLVLSKPLFKCNSSLFHLPHVTSWIRVARLSIPSSCRKKAWVLGLKLQCVSITHRGIAPSADECRRSS